MSMQAWRCHKIVHAGKIVRMMKGDFTGDFHVTVEGADGAVSPEYRVRAEVFARKMPEMGDYLVRYDDDYWSWSPAATFEAGYTLIAE